MTRFPLSAACHCGNLRLDIELSRPLETYNPRACDCDFCRQHGAAYLSDPAGSMAVSARDLDALGTYRQGSGNAQLLFCKVCGVYVGVVYEEAGRRFGALNSQIVLAEPGFATPLTVSPKTLSADAKTSRWKEVWFADVTLEARSDEPAQ